MHSSVARNTCVKWKLLSAFSVMWEALLLEGMFDSDQTFLFVCQELEWPRQLCYAFGSVIKIAGCVSCAFKLIFKVRSAFCYWMFEKIICCQTEWNIILVALAKFITSISYSFKFSKKIMFSFLKVLKIFCCNDGYSGIICKSRLCCVCRRVYHIRRNKAATTIQRHIRGWLKRTQFGRIKLCILGLQARSRGLLARRRYQQMRYNHKVCHCQSLYRSLVW